MKKAGRVLGAAVAATTALMSPAEAQVSDRGGRAESGLPASGFYAGAGINANLVVPTNQTIYAQGISNIFQGGAQTATGAAFGPTNPRAATASTISPSAQLGYFQTLDDSRWLLGGKVSYNHVGATSTTHFVLVPQIGSYAVSGNVTAFTGNVVIRSYQVTVDHQFSVVPYAGFTFDRSFVYLGAGPSLTHARTALANTVGFASINGATQSITGAPSTFASEQWLIGATLAAGATYFFTPSWFLEIGYSFTLTDLWNRTYAAPFSNTTASFTTTGILSGSYTGGVNTHTLTVSINRKF